MAIASGRPPFAMEQSLLEQVKFDYFVCSNGAFVRNAQHEVLYHYSFTMEAVSYTHLKRVMMSVVFYFM